jgi:CHAT domain-containing protein
MFIYSGTKMIKLKLIPISKITATHRSPRQSFVAKFIKIGIKYVCLALLTLLSVTIAIPAIAQHNLAVPIVQQAIAPEKLLEEGRTLYQTGRISQASQVWEKAAQEYQKQGEIVNQALSLNYLSLAYQDLGQWPQAEKAIASSLELLQQADSNSPLILAQALNTQGSLQLALGQTEAALDSWQKAEVSYAKAKDEVGVLGSQINQTQALQTLGLYRRARTTLEQINQKLQSQDDLLVKATGFRSLGATLQVVGDLNQSEEVLKQSLAISEQLNLPQEISATLFSLGNTARALGNTSVALEYYQKAAAIAPSNNAKLQAELNQLSLLVETQQWSSVSALLPQIKSQLNDSNPSRSSVYNRVNLAQSLMKYAISNRGESDLNLEIAKILATGLQHSRSLKDQRAESYALGTLGKLYEQQQQWQEAQNLTEQALQLAQAIDDSYISYQWEWQLGRIYKVLGDIPKAIASESEAVKTLQSIRNDLVAINPSVQFSFRESVEPVYRDLVGLLLRSPSPSSSEIPQENLQQARQVIESLQLAELENFFREACLEAQPKQIDQVDSQAAVIYPIILPDRLAVILSISGKPLSYYQTESSESEVENNLQQLLQSLNPAFSSQLRLRLSQKVYDWLIRPAETDLSNNGIKTLVFVLDGLLRNVPMSALYDGKAYLIEKYDVALTPGLQLLESKPIQAQQLKAVVAGLSQASQGFAALPGVEVELQQIESKVPSTQLLNQEFTPAKLQEQIAQSSSPILHLATHGQFSSDPNQTFILAWNERIEIKDFENLLRSRGQRNSTPVELLVLSACQTAAGDNRATLGLAGMAVRSGARSTIATLWSVKDESTVLLMSQFYQQLSQGKTRESKAEALRQAQLALLNSPNYKHPFYWAPFVLVGNWL